MSEVQIRYDDNLLSILINRINNHYCNLNLKMRLEMLNISSIKIICKYLKEDRLEFANALIEAYFANGISPFMPIIMNNTDIVAPIVVEKRNNICFLCDGMHRLYVAKQKRLKTIVCLVIVGNELPLPGDVVNWNDVRIVKDQVTLEQNFTNFNPVGFTAYSKFFNSNLMKI